MNKSLKVELVAWSGDVGQLAARLRIPKPALTARLKALSRGGKGSRLVVEAPPANAGPVLAALARRVELNAMDARQFLDWLEGKLQEHGVKKFIPDDAAAINAAWKRAWRIAELNKVIAKAAEDIPEPPEPPDNLAEQVRAALAEHPALRWDAALLENAP